MSYILEALKKSEQQRADVPAATAPQPLLPVAEPAPAPQAWLPLLVVLVCVLVAGALIWHVWQPVTVATPAVKPAAVVAQVSESTASVIVRPEPSVLPAQIETPAEAAEVLPATLPPPLSADSDLNTHSVPVIAAPVETRTLPPLSALRRIPALMINSHIYSPLPDKRSVTINNRPWREGEPLADGIILQEITPQGILLNVDGWTLPVNRQQGWTPVPD